MQKATKDFLVNIDTLIWDSERVEHIANHGVKPIEVEEVCFGKPFVQRRKSQGPNPVYYVLGQTKTGK